MRGSELVAAARSLVQDSARRCEKDLTVEIMFSASVELQ